jgi:hypothetical protein
MKLRCLFAFLFRHEWEAGLMQFKDGEAFTG